MCSCFYQKEQTPSTTNDWGCLVGCMTEIKWVGLWYIIKFEERISSLLGPCNSIHLSLCSSIQFQSLCQIHTPLHYGRILIQQFSQLLSLLLPNQILTYYLFGQKLKMKKRLLIITSFAPNSVKKWSSKVRLASRTWQNTTDFGMECLSVPTTIWTYDRTFDPILRR